MINKIWGFFIIVGIIFMLIFGRVTELNDTILTSATSGVNMILDLLPIIVLWSGIMKIAEKSGLLNSIVSSYIEKTFSFFKKR